MPFSEKKKKSGDRDPFFYFYSQGLFLEPRLSDFVHGPDPLSHHDPLHSFEFYNGEARIKTGTRICRHLSAADCQANLRAVWFPLVVCRQAGASHTPRLPCIGGTPA